MPPLMSARTLLPLMVGVVTIGAVAYEIARPAPALAPVPMSPLADEPARPPATPLVQTPSPAVEAPPVEPPPESPSEVWTYEGAYELVTTIRDGAFTHPRLDAAEGTTVHWRNTGDLVHSVVSTDGQFAGSGPIAQGEEFARTFQRVGEYPYHCRYHPDMTGVIVIA